MKIWISLLLYLRRRVVILEYKTKSSLMIAKSSKGLPSFKRNFFRSCFLRFLEDMNVLPDVPVLCVKMLLPVSEYKSPWSISSCGCSSLYSRLFRTTVKRCVYLEHSFSICSSLICIPLKASSNSVFNVLSNRKKI